MRRKGWLTAAAIASCACLPAQAGTVDDVQARFAGCDRMNATAEARYECRIKSTPRLCRGELTRNIRNFYSPIVQKRWFLCLSQCDDAGLVSRTVGECSTRGPGPAPQSVRQ